MANRKQSLPAAAEFFDRLPDSAEVDVRTISIVKGRSVATIWRHVARGLFPPPIPRQPGTNATRWRVGDVRKAAHVHETA